MISEKNRVLKTLCAAGCALIASVGAGDVTQKISQPFATPTATTALGTGDYAAWSGNGTVTNSVTAVYASATGKPIAGATDKNVLTVEGKVTCTAGTTGPTAVDMMVQVARPDEDLEALTDADVRFAVGVDKTGKLNVFCGPKSGTANAWHALPGEYAEGSWHRVTLRFDYTENICEVAVDGNPQVSEFGWQTPGKTGSAAGCWYPLVTTGSGLSTVQIVGTTAVDDVVVTQGALSELVPALEGTGGTSTIPNSWFVRNGVSSTGVADSTPASDNSDMTLKQKYLTGVSPVSGEKFEITGVTPAADGLTLSVPAAQPPAGYENVIEIKNGTSLVETQPIGAGSATVKVAAPVAATGAVKYTYQIKTVTK